MKPKFDKTRKLSWSSLSSYAWSKEEWYKKYILGIQPPQTPELDFGKRFAKSCEDRKPLAPVTLLSKTEHAFDVVFAGIPMIGYADTFCIDTFRKLVDHKTGKNAWTQQKADETGQLTMYALMNFITNKVRPEEMELAIEWIPTEQKGDFTIDFVRPIKVHRFPTRRTMSDILRFGEYIKSTYQDMQEFVKKHE